jgi:alanine dehydrogenase
MPGAVPRTSTHGLSNATLPFVRKLANLGFESAVQTDHSLALGVNTLKGHITYKAVADAFDMPYKPLTIDN